MNVLCARKHGLCRRKKNAIKKQIKIDLVVNIERAPYLRIPAKVSTFCFWHWIFVCLVVVFFFFIRLPIENLIKTTVKSISCYLLLMLFCSCILANKCKTRYRYAMKCKLARHPLKIANNVRTKQHSHWQKQKRG